MRIFIAVVGLVAIIVVAGKFTVQPVVRAQDGCTNASFKGAYGFAINGFYYFQFRGPWTSHLGRLLRLWH